MNNLKGKKYAQQTTIAVLAAQKVLELQTINNTFLQTIHKGVTIMKNSIFSRLAVMTVVAVLFAASTQQLFAAGTRAGTKLTSTATIQYKDKNNVDMPNVDGEVSVYVAHKPASTLVVGTANQEGYDGGFVVYSMTVNNNGNGQDKFQFLTDSASYYFVDSVGFYKNVGLTEHLLGTSKNVLQDTVTNDGNATVYAKVYLKADPSYPSYLNAVTTINFRTRSTANNSDTTYLTEDGLQNRVVATAFLNALSSQDDVTTKIKQSRLAISTTNAAGYSGAPGVGTGHRPGATVGYAVSVTNTGHGRSQSTVVRVDYPSGMSFASGTGWTDNTTYATYNFAEVDPGETATTPGTDSLKLLLADNYSQIEGTTRSPSLSVEYNDSTNGLNARTRHNGVTPSSFTIKFKSYAPTITAIDTVETGDAGDSVTYVFKLKNNSNGYDYFDVRQTLATQGTWDAKGYHDFDNSGGLVRGVDSLFTSEVDGYRTKTHINRDDTIRIFIRNVIPSGLSSETVYLQYKGSSARDSVTAGDFNLYGNVTPLIPNIVVTRARVLHDSISAGAGAAASIAPGGSATFYVDITNDGTGKATNVIITDDLGARAEFAPFGGQDTVWVWDGVAALPAGEGHVLNPNGSYAADDKGYSEVKKDGTGYVIKIANLEVGERRRVRYRVTLQ